MFSEKALSFISKNFHARSVSRRAISNDPIRTMGYFCTKFTTPLQVGRRHAPEYNGINVKPEQKFSLFWYEVDAAVLLSERRRLVNSVQSCGEFTL